MFQLHFALIGMKMKCTTSIMQLCAVPKYEILYRSICGFVLKRFKIEAERA